MRESFNLHARRFAQLFFSLIHRSSKARYNRVYYTLSIHGAKLLLHTLQGLSERSELSPCSVLKPHTCAEMTNAHAVSVSGIYSVSLLSHLECLGTALLVATAVI